MKGNRGGNGGRFIRSNWIIQNVLCIHLQASLTRGTSQIIKDIPWGSSRTTIYSYIEEYLTKIYCSKKKQYRKLINPAYCKR